MHSSVHGQYAFISVPVLHLEILSTSILQQVDDFNLIWKQKNTLIRAYKTELKCRGHMIRSPIHKHYKRTTASSFNSYNSS